MEIIRVIREYCDTHSKWGGFPKAYPDIYAWVLEATNFLLGNASISQRLWHVYHDIWEVVICKNEECTKATKWYQGSYRSYCSVQCSCKSESANNKRKQSYKNKYGVSSFGDIRKNKDIKRKTEKTLMKKYGSKDYFSSKDFKDKNKQTLIERYCVTHYAQTPYFAEKCAETLQSRYGVEHNLQISEALNSREKTWQRKYGGHPLSNESIRQKIKQTNMERYGVDVPTKNAEIAFKIHKTALTKHNRNNPAQYNISDDSFKLLEDIEWLTDKRANGWSFPAIASYLGVDTTTVVSRFKKFGIPYVPFNIQISSSQQEVIDYIQSLGLECIVNDREIIKPLEIDIVIPEIKVGIEYCGLYWHSEQFLDKDYHLFKFKKMRDQGYKLITIFEDEWMERREIVKSVLAMKLHKSSSTNIFARKCTIEKNPNKNKVQEFLEINHLQGKASYTEAISLLYEDEMVAVMTFLVNGREATLNRFCVKLDTSVIGGATKMFKWYLKDCTVEKIKTFADLRWSDGEVYQKMGFDSTHLLRPSYFYVLNNKRYHKFLFRKKKMRHKIDNYDPALTEHQNALNNNIFRVYDCGYLKFEKIIKQEIT